jgi:hypothetical protein
MNEERYNMQILSVDNHRFYTLSDQNNDYQIVKVLLADDHVNNVSYFPFMSIKKVVSYFCVLREGYYVIIWLIVKYNCIVKFIKKDCSSWYTCKSILNIC